MSYNQPYILYILIGTTILNMIIALGAKLKTRNKDFNDLFFYWGFILLTYVALLLVGKTPIEIAFGYFVKFIPSFLMAKMLMDSRGIKFNLKLYGPLHLIGTIITAYLVLATGTSLPLALLPIIFTTILPYWHPIWDTHVTNRKKTNWIEKSVAIVFIAAILNHLNYAFYSNNTYVDWWVWMVFVFQYQCLSILLPVLINDRRGMKEKKNLEMTLQKLSGENTSYNLEIGELYRSLDEQINKQEQLTTKLQNANTQLEEERELHDILIKTVSHDLANPLTVINAYIDMMNAGRIPEEDRQMIWDRVKMNTKSALDMIARIRDAIITRNQASIIGIHNVSIDRSIKRLIIQFESQLQLKNIKLKYENLTPANTCIAAEENTLTEHVFANILSNALKFSHEGSEIIVSVIEADSSIIVQFKDFGVGIDANRLARRLLTTTEGTKGETGSGFGVMVMGYFLRKFDAPYSIHSEGLGHGTTVTIKLKKSALV